MSSAGGREWRAAGAGLVTGLALLLSACGQTNPSVAAYVGTQTITERQVDQALQAVRTSLGSEQQVSKTAVVNALLQGELAAQIAQASNLSITDGQREKLLVGSSLAPLLDSPQAKQVAYDIADTELVSRALGDAGYLAALAKHDVTLNPRYGVLDPTQKTIVPDSSGSLSVAEPAPAGS